jgi:sterol 14-demethylase
MQEQREVMAKHEGKLTVESIKDMQLLQRCMKEVLRMYPPLILLMRMVKKERKCGPYTVPVGSILTVSPAASMKLNEVFSDPTVFNPDRFIAPLEEDKKYQYAFIGFGGGRHRCLGESFAYLQVTAVLSVMLRTFDFEPVDKFPKVNYDSMVAGPSPPCRVKFTRKKGTTF